MNPDGAFCEMSYIRKKDSVIKKHENKNAAKLKTFQVQKNMSCLGAKSQLIK